MTRNNICPHCNRNINDTMIGSICKTWNDSDMVSMQVFTSYIDCKACALQFKPVINRLEILTKHVSEGDGITEKEAIAWLIDNIMGIKFKKEYGNIKPSEKPDQSVNVLSKDELEKLVTHK